MSILKSMWNGKILPQQKNYQSNEKFKRIREQMQDEYTLLIDEMSEAGKLHFENYEYLAMEIQSVCDEENFIEAFRLGAKMMLEIMEEKEYEQYTK